MTFVLRAVLVIGALSYFALARGGGDPAAGMRRLAEGLPSPQDAVAAAVPAAMAGLREGAVAAAPRSRDGQIRDAQIRDTLARGLMAELSRRAAAEPPSGDTLEDADRRPAWRGVEPR